jgi:polyphenol oxidase
MLAPLSGVRHAFFTRRGGVSEGVYAGLNVGVGSGDDPAAVTENRRRAAAHFGQAEERLMTCYQVHSPDCWIITASVPQGRPTGDALVTDRPGLICGALAADCAPVLLADADAGVVGAAHAGWKGALSGVLENTVRSMERLGARASSIRAAVGPCIGPQSYEVGPEFFDRFTAVDPGFVRFFSEAEATGKRRFDLPGFVVGRLHAAGVDAAEWVGRDTYAEPDAFYSNRRAFHRGEGDYGRLLSAIMLS